MKRRRPRIALWTIGALVALILVVGGVLVNVRVLDGDEAESAGSLSPVVETSMRDETMAPTVGPVVVAARRDAARRRVEAARRARALATARTQSQVPSGSGEVPTTIAPGDDDATSGSNSGSGSHSGSGSSGSGTDDRSGSGSDDD